MARCAANKPDGTPCERIVGASQKYCYAHDPHHQQARSRAASKAARSKPSRELTALKEQLFTLYEDVREGRIESKIGAVVNQNLSISAETCQSPRYTLARSQAHVRYLAARTGCPPAIGTVSSRARQHNHDAGSLRALDTQHGKTPRRRYGRSLGIVYC
jgi:hypothetical protein